MLLAKSCHKKDNIKIRKTLKLGSLFEYRHTELKQIADPEEGSFAFNLKFDGVVTLEKKWLNNLCYPLLNFGGEKEDLPQTGEYKCDIEVIRVGNSTDTTTELIDTAMTMRRQVKNSFIFCMSSVRLMRHSIGIFPDYDDCWYMPASKIHPFAVRISETLLSTIKTRHASEEYIVPKETNLDELYIRIRVGKVHYLPRELHITEQTSNIFVDFIKNMDTMAFIKPPVPFEKELEYRFQFILESNGIAIEPLVNSVILFDEDLALFAL